MLGYISSTRKKSCDRCVKAKRRCDLGYPFCKRCFVKGLDCKYPNAQKAGVSVEEAVVIRQSTPDFSAPIIAVPILSGDDVPDPDIAVNIDPLFLPLAEHASSSDRSDLTPENWANIDWSQNLHALQPYEAPPICEALLPQLWEPTILNERQVLSVMHGLCAFVPEMAFSGSTPFLHHQLYQTHQPDAYQDCVALSALYLTNSSRNHTILANSIISKIRTLTASAPTWTLTEHLAAVQALIIYQIIRLFDPTLGLQAQAEKHNALLELWAATLWKRWFNEPQSGNDDYEAWVFNESLRRTIIMSVFTRCAWHAFNKGGLASQVHVLARLPFTKDLGAWGCERGEWEGRVRPRVAMEEGLVAYGDMAAMWKGGGEVEVRVLGSFGRLLLAACRGGEDPRLLVG